jgi:hypothetical protein
MDYAAWMERSVTLARCAAMVDMGGTVSPGLSA